MPSARRTSRREEGKGDGGKLEVNGRMPRAGGYGNGKWEGS